MNYPSLVVCLTLCHSAGQCVNASRCSAVKRPPIKGPGLITAHPLTLRLFKLLNADGVWKSSQPTLLQCYCQKILNLQV